MTGMTDYTADHFLDYEVGKTAMPALPTVSIGLFSAVGTSSKNKTELNNGTSPGYARVSTLGTNWNAGAGSQPSSNSNSANLVFPTATGSWVTAIAVGGFDGSSNLMWWDYLGNFAWLPFTCTLASPGVITAPAHGYSNGDSVVVTAEYGGTLPTTGGSWSGLLTLAGATTDTFNLGVNTTSTGSGLLRKVTPITVANGQAFVFTGGTPGNLVLVAA